MASADPLADPVVLLEAPENARADIEAAGIRLSWDAPEGTDDSGAPVAYRVIAHRNGVPDNAVSVPSSDFEYFDSAAFSTETVTYRLTAIYGNGDESLPILLFVGNPYPPCYWLVYTLNPPAYVLRPECLLPWI